MSFLAIPRDVFPVLCPLTKSKTLFLQIYQLVVPHFVFKILLLDFSYFRKYFRNIILPCTSSKVTINITLVTSPLGLHVTLYFHFLVKSLNIRFLIVEILTALLQYPGAEKTNLILYKTGLISCDHTDPYPQKHVL